MRWISLGLEAESDHLQDISKPFAAIGSNFTKVYETVGHCTPV